MHRNEQAQCIIMNHMPHDLCCVAGGQDHDVTHTVQNPGFAHMYIDSTDLYMITVVLEYFQSVNPLEIT